LIVLREEFDDWAVLFDPDTGNAFGLNPVGVFVWKRLDGNNTFKQISKDLGENCEDTPEDVDNHLQAFIQDLVQRGLVGYETVTSPCD
jgi:SynChlorMet cassette protein ScmD